MGRHRQILDGISDHRKLGGAHTRGSQSAGGLVSAGGGEALVESGEGFHLYIGISSPAQTLPPERSLSLQGMSSTTPADTTPQRLGGLLSRHRPCADARSGRLASNVHTPISRVSGFARRARTPHKQGGTIPVPRWPETGRTSESIVTLAGSSVYTGSFYPKAEAGKTFLNAVQVSAPPILSKLLVGDIHRQRRQASGYHTQYEDGAGSKVNRGLSQAGDPHPNPVPRGCLRAPPRK